MTALKIYLIIHITATASNPDVSGEFLKGRVIGYTNRRGQSVGVMNPIMNDACCSRTYTR